MRLSSVPNTSTRISNHDTAGRPGTPNLQQVRRPHSGRDAEYGESTWLKPSRLHDVVVRFVQVTVAMHHSRSQQLQHRSARHPRKAAIILRTKISKFDVDNVKLYLRGFPIRFNAVQWGAPLRDNWCGWCHLGQTLDCQTARQLSYYGNRPTTSGSVC